MREILSYWLILVSEIVATCFGNENELPRCVKTGNVFGLLGHYWLVKWKFLPWCCVVNLKESGSEGVDCILTGSSQVTLVGLCQHDNDSFFRSGPRIVSPLIDSQPLKNLHGFIE